MLVRAKQGEGRLPKTIVVVGLDDFNLRLMRDLPGADDYDFLPVLGYDEIVRPDRYDLPGLLRRAEARLRAHQAPIDAIVTFWDFPSSTIMPIMRAWFDLPGPSLEAVLKCEHKYWSRLEQAASVSEHVPGFAAVDPFADQPERQIDLAFPYWLKPVKAHSSHLGFKIRHDRDFRQAIEQIRAGIHRLAEPFNHILGFAELPPEVKGIDGNHCIAEEMISAGRQCTLEGYALDGEVVVYGVVDSIREGEHRSSFARYQYPSRLPRRVRERMAEIAGRFFRHAGYDGSPFNIEFYWEEKSDSLRLLEANARISKSHCPLFEMVDGVSHHQVMIDVALGRRPDFPHRRGRHKVAAKFMLRLFEDGIVTRVPTADDIARVQERFPGTRVRLMVEEGARLAHLKLQDSYSFEIAEIFMGAESQPALKGDYEACLAMLDFRHEPLRSNAA
jgi:biotin carboxylase